MQLKTSHQELKTNFYNLYWPQYGLCPERNISFFLPNKNIQKMKITNLSTFLIGTKIEKKKTGLLHGQFVFYFDFFKIKSIRQ